MKRRISETDIDRLVNKIINEYEDSNMIKLRKSAEEYDETDVPISKKTGEIVRNKEVPFKGYNLKDSDIPMNVRSFYNNFKKSLNTFNIKPSKTPKEEILKVIADILTINGFK